MKSAGFFLAGVSLSITAWLYGCTATPQLATVTSIPGEILTPYVTRTVIATATPRNLQTSTPIPDPSPTPVKHIVQRGEDMGGIAYTYKVTLKALMDANPEVSPNMMSVGTVLVIPSSGQAAATSEEIIPPPDGVTFEDPVCYQTAEGGLQCFSLINNASSSYIGNIKARLSINKPGESPVLQNGFPLLEILPPNGVGALLTYFPPTVTGQFNIIIDQISASRVSKKTAEKVKVLIDSQQIDIQSDGLSAELNGRITLSAPEKAESRVQVSGIVFDEDGRIVGGRRWEFNGTGGLQTIPFVFRVYSQGGSITRASILAAAAQ
jgi:LysM repeat protein